MRGSHVCSLTHDATGLSALSHLRHLTRFVFALQVSSLSELRPCSRRGARTLLANLERSEPNALLTHLHIKHCAGRISSW